ncbi:hypothetical protein DIPPA_22621 [Diplonema papillatum]|nr:hypothetical protein DIPPA_22621 [Diplonema papillatum]
MPPKKKGDEAPPPAADRRPRSAADDALESAQSEVAASEEKLGSVAKRHEANVARAACLKRLEEQVGPVEENRKKVAARFKKILSDRPTSGTAPGTPTAAPNGTLPAAPPSPLAAGLEQDSDKPASNSYRQLVADCNDVLLRILADTFRAPRTKRELDEKAAAEEPAAAALVPPPALKGVPKVDTDHSAATPRLEGDGGAASDEFKLPLGVSSDVFARVLELRQARLAYEDEAESLKGQIDVLRGELAAEKAEGVGKALIKRLEKILHARREEEKEALRRVAAEDAQFQKALEEELWQKHVRAQAEDAANQAKKAKK